MKPGSLVRGSKASRLRDEIWSTKLVNFFSKTAIRNPLIQRLDDGSEAGSDENKDENQLPNGKTDQISGLFEKFRAFCSGWKKTEANSDTPAAIFGQKMNTRKVGRSSK